ncbi:hypothetical protein CRYUN_Cryun34aG0103300 [Craigia yunnanensis]
MILVGALAGFTASTISFPLEVARKRLMVGALQGKCPPNMAAALAEVIRDEGLTVQEGASMVVDSGLFMEALEWNPRADGIYEYVLPVFI